MGSDKDVDSGSTLNISGGPPVSAPVSMTLPQDIPMQDEPATGQVESMQLKSEQRFWKFMIGLKNPLIVTFAFVVLLVVLIIVSAVVPPRDEVVSSANSWGDCVLRNYDGNNNNNSNNSGDSWISECGEHPEVRLNFFVRQLSFNVVRIQGIILILVYLPKVIKFSRKCYKRGRIF